MALHTCQPHNAALTYTILDFRALGYGWAELESPTVIPGVCYILPRPVRKAV